MDTLKVFYVQAVLAALALCIVHEGHEARQIGYRLESMRRETESRATERVHASSSDSLFRRC